MTEWISGSLFIRPNHLLKKGNKIVEHVHNFDHNAIFFKGSFKVTVNTPDGRTIIREFAAPGHEKNIHGGCLSHCLVKKQVRHEIEALEDDSIFWCVYSHQTPQEPHVVSQVYTGWDEAYW